ncbi:UDP-N-acetylglucosamine--N-acetylmuramyl-(pentapeptide) pyrophosphoryl-undecaprenol N-acetylglucosamine transferase [Coriobacteriaceae bacterium CHKCI002]|nr:UDP-N-acetylglucosamine--N-acetylmuramyl-(pentapeptide) pyrophosphoryl-undecaprenol N-acetylglucosamine transferase [Coriobacteriaceae bacterium CHKCI002]
MAGNGKVNICLVSSSGGHWEQLRKLQPLIDKYGGFYVTEKTPFVDEGPYLMVQTDLKDKLMPIKMLVNGVRAIRIWAKERPDVVVTTGTMVAYPFYLLAVLFRKRFVFIETFGRSNEPTVAGKLMQKRADLFFVQWESQRRFYQNARYVGCLY